MITSDTFRWHLIIAFLLFAFSAEAQVPNSPAAGASVSGYRVAGTVVNKIDGRPLPRARIILRDSRKPKEFEGVITSDDGKFEFNNLPARKFSLTGSKKGFITSGYDQHENFWTAIVTGAGLDTEHLVLKLSPAAIITGRVLDEAGEPVRHASVQLYFDNHVAGVDQISPFRAAGTDDRGVYELAPLIPGTYYLSVSASPWYAVHPHGNRAGPETAEDSAATKDVDRSLDVAYPTTYYADVLDTDSATPIPVQGGERLEIDLHLNPVPALRVVFRVPNAGENNYVFPRLQQPTFDGETVVPLAQMNMVSPGVFEMTGVPAGRYDVRLQGAATSQVNGVDFTKDGEDLDVSEAQAMSTVKVSVRLPGQASLPDGLALALQGKGRTIPNWKKLDSKGEAQIDQIPAGRYQVVVWGARKPVVVASLSSQDTEVAGHTLVVHPGSSPSLSVTLSTGESDLNGTVKRAGKPFAGAMVVLIPNDPDNNHDLFRRDQSDLDGTFIMRSVIPGSYTILAIENGWDLEWSKPGVIAAYAKGGRKIEIGDHEVNLTDAIEVQSK